MVMLNRGSKYFLLFFVLIVGCGNPSNDLVNDESSVSLYYQTKSLSIIGRPEYINIYNNASDSIAHWQINNLGDYSFAFKQIKKLDSLICFNKSGDRLVSAIHRYRNESSPSDELLFFYGEKINGLWYFFRSGSVTLPRDHYKHSFSSPLSYRELHNIALKEIFASYLLPNGQINEKFFTDQFEGSGWGDLTTQELSDWCFKGKRYTDLKEFYKAVHLCKVKANWMSRDTTQPIIPLPPKDLK